MSAAQWNTSVRQPSSFRSSAGQFAGGVAKSFMGGNPLNAQGFGAMAGAAMQKIGGIPSPFGPKTGAALGSQLRAEQEAQFPGTNPWERLRGSSAQGGAIETAKQHGKIQKELQTKELATRLQVAGVAAGAHVEAARVTSAPAASRAPSQIRETELKAAHQAIVNKYAPELQRAVITDKKWSKAGPTIWNAMEEAEKAQFGNTSDIGKAGVRVTGAMIAAGIMSMAGRKFMAIGRAMGGKVPYSGKVKITKAVPSPTMKKGGLRQKTLKQSNKNYGPDAAHRKAKKYPRGYY